MLCLHLQEEIDGALFFSLHLAYLPSHPTPLQQTTRIQSSASMNGKIESD